MEDQKNITDLRKALEDLDLSVEEIDGILAKAQETSEVADEGNQGVADEGASNDDGTQVERTEEIIKSEIGELEKSLEDKRGELETSFPTKEEVSAAISTEDIAKAVTEGLEAKFGDIISQLEVEKEEKTELVKAIEVMQDTLNGMANQGQGMRARNGSASFLEKSENGEEEKGKFWHVVTDKANIQKALQSLADDSKDDTLIKSYEDALIGYTASGNPESLKAVAKDIEKANDITLVK